MNLLLITTYYLMRKPGIFLLLVLFSLAGYSQEGMQDEEQIDFTEQAISTPTEPNLGDLYISGKRGFQYEVREDSMKHFKKKVKYAYTLYSESVLTIIDEDIERIDKYRAKNVLVDLFQTSNRKFSVRDYIANPYPKKMTIAQYADALYEAEDKLPIYYRKYKLSDSIMIKQTSRGIRNTYAKGKEADRRNKYFTSYKGELYFLEHFINSELSQNGYFDVKEREILKKLAFSITHNDNNKYELVLESIDIIDPRDKSYDYKKLKGIVQRSSEPWRDSPLENYAEITINEAKQNGILDLVKLKQHKSPTKLKKYNSLYEFNTPNFGDYLIPGLGYKKFGPKHKSRRNTIIYSTLFWGSTVSAIFYKRRGGRQLDNIGLFSTEQEIAAYHQAEDNDIRMARILGATAGATLIANAIHLSIMHSKRKRVIQKTKYKRFDLNFIKKPQQPKEIDGVGASLIFEF